MEVFSLALFWRCCSVSWVERATSAHTAIPGCAVFSALHSRSVLGVENPGKGSRTAPDITRLAHPSPVYELIHERLVVRADCGKKCLEYPFFYEFKSSEDNKRTSWWRKSVAPMSAGCSSIDPVLDSIMGGEAYREEE